MNRGTDSQVFLSAWFLALVLALFFFPCGFSDHFFQITVKYTGTQTWWSSLYRQILFSELCVERIQNQCHFYPNVLW